MLLNAQFFLYLTGTTTELTVELNAPAKYLCAWQVLDGQNLHTTNAKEQNAQPR
jgi:hypothetical protein